MSEPEEVSREIPQIGDGNESAEIEISERDIVFECPHCRGELVVDRDGAGLVVNCVFCRQPVTVPSYTGPSLHYLQAATAKLSDALRTTRTSNPKNYRFEGRTREELNLRAKELQAQLRDVQSQASEVRGLLNHARIQLHRYQLKLEMLHERQSELKSELDALLGFTRAAENDQPAEEKAPAQVEESGGSGGGGFSEGR